MGSLGLIPCGSRNGFAKHCPQSANLNRNLQHANVGREQPVIGEEAKRITRGDAAAGQPGKPDDATEIGLLKGTMEALEQVSIEKNCNIQFQHG